MWSIGVANENALFVALVKRSEVERRQFFTISDHSIIILISNSGAYISRCGDFVLIDDRQNRLLHVHAG